MFLNMKLLAQHTLNGFGGMGEGMSMQLARDGRRVLWLAHESAPKNFTAVDVSDPRSPQVIVQTDLAHAQMRSNSLEVAGDLMAVAYQVTKFGLKPAGFELFDPAVYYISEIPSELRASDVLLVSITAFALTLLATIYPARRAAATEPAEALRYE